MISNSHAELWEGLSTTDERFLGTDLKTFETTAEYVRDFLTMHSSYDRRPGPTKEVCNGIYPGR